MPEGKLPDTSHQPSVALRRLRVLPGAKELLTKLSFAASKYDPLRDGIYVKQSFDGGYMDLGMFERAVHVALQIRLTRAQVSCLADALSGTELHDDEEQSIQWIDPHDFLNLFTELGFIEKSKRHKRLLEQRNRVAEALQKEVMEREEQAHARATKVVITEYRQEDLNAAIAKVKKASVLFDPHHPSSIQLTAFDALSLPAYAFKDQLKKCFGINLTHQEFSGLLHYFHKHKGDESAPEVDSMRFLLHFMKVGAAEKARIWAARRDRDLRKEEQRVKDMEAKRAAADVKNALKVSFEFTEADKDSALVKLGDAAAMYDKNAPACVGLEAFEGKNMQPHVFKEQLKATFNIKVSAGELGALVKHFDRDGSGTVSTRDFLAEFLRTGLIRKNQEKQAWKARQAKKLELRLAEERKKKEEADKKHEFTLPTEFSDEDFNSAMEKVTEKALRYDKTHPSSPSLAAFEGESLSPHVFREQLKLTLNIHLTLKELAALVHAYDKDGSENVSCQEFVSSFFKKGFQERQRLRKLWRRRQAKKVEKEEKEKQRKQQEADEKSNLHVSKDYSTADFDSAIRKITNASALYDKHHPSAVQLDSFDEASMTPLVFKNQMWRVFSVKLAPKELGALVDHFSPDGTDKVNCAEFLLQFFKLGFEERSRRVRIYKEKQKLYEERARKEAQRKAQKEVAKSFGAAVAFNDQELDAAVDKLIDMSIRYSRRCLGIIGLKAFEIPEMDPAQFRTILYQTFYVTLSPGETGAIMAYFDRNSSGTIDMSEFLSQFFRLSHRTKWIVGRKHGRRKLAELKGEVKESIRARNYDFEKLLIQLSESVAGQSSADSEDEAVPDKGLPPATTPRSKLDRRIVHAEARGKLDLSTYNQVQHETDFCLGELPAGVEGFTGLRELWLTNNRINEPSRVALSRYIMLQTLSLSGNQMSSLPPELKHLQHLQRLYVDHNQLEEVPSDLFLACGSSLRELKLDHNRLTAIPWAAMLHMKYLEVLDLRHNMISDLHRPASSEGQRQIKLARLQSLHLDGNRAAAAGAPPFFDLSFYRCFPNLRSLSAADVFELGKTKKTQAAHEVWTGLPKLQTLRLSQRRSLVRPTRGVFEDDASSLFLGEMYVGRDTDIRHELQGVIRKRKLVANNYIKCMG